MTARAFATYRSSRRLALYPPKPTIATTHEGLADSMCETADGPTRGQLRKRNLDLWRAKSRANATPGQDHATAKMLFNDRQRRSRGRWYSGKPT